MGTDSSSSLEVKCSLEVKFHFICFKIANLELFTNGLSFSWSEFKLELECAANMAMVGMTFYTGRLFDM